MLLTLLLQKRFAPTPPAPGQSPSTAGSGGILDQIQAALGPNTLMWAFLAVVVIFLILVTLLIVTIVRRVRSRDDMAQPAGRSIKPAQAEVKTFPSKAAYGIQLTLPDKRTATFSTLPVLIGYDPGNTLIVQEASVSDYHARIYYDPLLQSVCIEDLDSQNGVLINGKPTRKNILQSNDKISLGDAVIQYQDTGYIPEQEA